MSHRKKAKQELNCALSDILNAQQLLTDALKCVERKDNKQILQDTLSTLNAAVDTTRTSTYGFLE